MTEKRHLNKRTEMHLEENCPCNAIPSGFAQLKDITNKEMAPHTESTTTKLEIFIQSLRSYHIANWKIPERHSG